MQQSGIPEPSPEPDPSPIDLSPVPPPRIETYFLCYTATSDAGHNLQGNLSHERIGPLDPDGMNQIRAALARELTETMHRRGISAAVSNDQLTITFIVNYKNL